MMAIDLNCDLGEGSGHDEAIMPWITSANIACGGHAGDDETMGAAVALARRHGVAVGAHPGFADREHFGRGERRVAPHEIERLVAAQIAALTAWGPVRHVKPHGALYNLAAREPAIARAVASAVWTVDPALTLVGLAGGALIEAGRARGLRVAREFFADRTYRPDGALTPRTEANALVAKADEAVAQALRMVREGVVRATNGAEVRIAAETICLHGDGPDAAMLARCLRGALAEAGVTVKAL